jgi:teichuronic acid biosynthesis glycosyltransferase TuaG
MPDVSVVIPTWNRAELLVNAVRSALTQTIPPLEVLVCDDGSTDESEKVVRAMGDTRVRWLTGERAGCPAIPRNRGIRESQGEWIAFLDNDDEWLPDKLEKQLRFAELTGCKAVCCNASRYVPAQGVKGNYLTCDCERITFDDLLRVNQVICSSAVIYRTLFEKVEGFPESPELKAWEDYALWLRLAVLTDFAYLSEPLLLYRDDVANSIRSQEVDVLSQRRTVFADFQTWGQRKSIDESYLQKLQNRLQRERIDWIFDRVLASANRIKKALLP